ncbi:MAG: hypothetical protein WB685_16235, partial [Pseudolabrys sp.]
LELRILLDCQRSMMDVALNHSGAIQLDAVGMDRAVGSENSIHWARATAGATGVKPDGFS